MAIARFQRKMCFTLLELAYPGCPEKEAVKRV